MLFKRAHIPFWLRWRRQQLLKMAQKSFFFFMADVKTKDKWAGNEMHKCEDEGNKGCASLFGPLRLSLAALFFSLSVNAEYSIIFFFLFHLLQIGKWQFLSISHGICISGRANKKLKARLMGGLGRKWICDVMHPGTEEHKGVLRGIKEAIGCQVSHSCCCWKALYMLSSS